MAKNELDRLRWLCVFEEEARKKGYRVIAGVDEAGRGPLAGPVVAAACILPENLLIEGVDDSKKLTAGKRLRVFDRITQDSSILYAIGIVESEVIDQINILQATFQAMLAAVVGLSQKPDYVLVDGHLLPPFQIPAQGIIKGDSLSQSIAAASIIAKETRDRLMIAHHRSFPQYGFDRHKGYGTAQHLEALALHGPCPIHRLSFEPLKVLNCACIKL